MFDLYYSNSRDEVGINTKENLLQFSDEPNMFYVLTPEWEYVCKVDFPTTEEQWEEIDAKRALEKALRHTESLPADNFGEEEAVLNDLPSVKDWN